MGSSGSDTTTVQQSDPWAGQQPYLSDIYSQAAGMYNQGVGFNPYSGPTVAGMSDIQKQGSQFAYDQILSGRTPAQTAENTLNTIMQGGYNQANPYLTQATAQNLAGRGQMLQGTGIQGQSFSNQFISQATGGQPQTTSQAELERTMSGDYLNTPFSNQFISQATGWQPQTTSQAKLERTMSGDYLNTPFSNQFI